MGKKARRERGGKTSKVGRLEILNGHGKLAGTLWEADGTRWTCHFKDEHLGVLANAWLRTVRVSGKVIEVRKERTLQVDAIIITDEEIVSEYTAGEASPFWESMSLEELAEQQGVAAVDNLDEIAALWPGDDDPDDLLAHILDERRARRRSGSDGEGA